MLTDAQQHLITIAIVADVPILFGSIVYSVLISRRLVSHLREFHHDRWSDIGFADSGMNIARTLRFLRYAFSVADNNDHQVAGLKVRLQRGVLQCGCSLGAGLVMLYMLTHKLF